MFDRQPIPEREAVAIIERAVSEDGGRTLTRIEDLYLATAVAELLHEQLVLAGVSLVRQDLWL